MRGLFDVPNEVIPRIKNSALSAPGSPDRWYEITPARRPANEPVKLELGCLSSAGLIVLIDPITLFFFCF